MYNQFTSASVMKINWIWDWPLFDLLGKDCTCFHFLHHPPSTSSSSRQCYYFQRWRKFAHFQILQHLFIVAIEKLDKCFVWSVDNCDYSHLWKWWVMPKIEHLSSYCHGLLTLHSVPDLFLVPWILVMKMHFTSISSHLFWCVYIVKNSMNVTSNIQGILFSWIES